MLESVTSSTSLNQMTGSWAGKYTAERAGTVDVKMSFYQLDPAALAQLPKGLHHSLETGQETVVGIYQGTSGAIGTIAGTLAGQTFSGFAQQTTPGCCTTFVMNGTVSDDGFTWTFAGADCLGPEDGTGSVKRVS